MIEKPSKKEIIIEYDSDSEDEDDYEYEGCKSLQLSGKNKFKGVVLFRGIHFSPSIFGKKDRSRERRCCKADDSIFSLAVYDIASVKCTDRDKKVSSDVLTPIAEYVREQIIDLEDRDEFQQNYTNKYNKFLAELTDRYDVGSSENPQVSTSEEFVHAGRYAFGKKFLCKGVEKLKPEYDKTGKPKHPYLGKIYVVLMDISDKKRLSPYFVAFAHANKLIKVSSHFSNNILSECEVSFPGFIPGKCIVYEKAVRLPSFAGEYKVYYKKKYGITKRSFEIIKGKLTKTPKKTETEVVRKRGATVENLIKKVINHIDSVLRDHMIEECSKNEIKI
jgi:hypothetical protein